jgi:hypothetical protein
MSPFGWVSHVDCDIAGFEVIVSDTRQPPTVQIDASGGVIYETQRTLVYAVSLACDPAVPGDQAGNSVRGHRQAEGAHAQKELLVSSQPAT